MHARYYSPTLGRFLSVDPVYGDIDVPQSWNGYSYVLDNPVNLVDPDGMLWKQIWDALSNTFSASVTVQGYTDDYLRERSREFSIYVFRNEMRWRADGWLEIAVDTARTTGSQVGQSFGAFADGLVPYGEPFAAINAYDASTNELSHYSGEVISTVAGAYVGARTLSLLPAAMDGSVLLGPAGPVFGKDAWLNKGPLRVGYHWDNTALSNRGAVVFRLGVGPRGAWHYNFWVTDLTGKVKR